VSGAQETWRQKGTGRARAAASARRCGGRRHHLRPQPRDYAYRLPKTARRAALRAALASRHAAGTLLVVDDLRLPSQDQAHDRVPARLGLEGASVLIVLAGRTRRSSARRNLPHVKVLVAQGLNVYDVLGHAHLVLTRAALETVAGRLGGAREPRRRRAGPDHHEKGTLVNEQGNQVVFRVHPTPTRSRSGRRSRVSSG